MKKYNWEEEKIKEAIKECFCFNDVLRKLGVNVSGNNAETLKRKIKEFNIDTSHFTFHSGGSLKTKKDINEYLKIGSHGKASVIKRKLIESGLKENKCEICGISTWLGKRIVCQLHHINGDNTDNRLENLQILCPNCHSQTENYCGSANKSDKPKNYCSECGRELKTKNATLCLSCASKHRKKVQLTRDEFITCLKKNNCNRFQTGMEIGVSEATIRKMAKNFGLPTKSKELINFIKNI